jgi:hypothetical protein
MRFDLAEDMKKPDEVQSTKAKKPAFDKDDVTVVFVLGSRGLRSDLASYLRDAR